MAGVHWTNLRLMAEPAIDLRRPEVLMYEPAAGRKPRLVGIEYTVYWTGQPAPSVLGRRMLGPLSVPSVKRLFYWQHVWLYERNRAGVFATFNPKVHC